MASFCSTHRLKRAALLSAAALFIQGCAQLAAVDTVEPIVEAQPSPPVEPVQDAPEIVQAPANTDISSPQNAINSADEWIALQPVVEPIAAPAGPPAAELSAADVTEHGVAKQNIWHEFREQLTWNYPSNKRIAAEKKWFVKHPDYLVRVFNRGSPYFAYIVSELQKNNIPIELALLPVVESAYQPFAFSHGRATGIWQFIPSTGRLYGLKQNWWYDGRRDIVASTAAAIAFFTRLNADFKGDWLHSLAAYNAGPGRVQRAIKRNKKKGLPTSFWDLKLPKETRHYVPKLLALIEVMSDPAAYGLTLPAIDTHPQFQIVDIRKQLDLSRAAKMADITIEQMYLLNPGFNRWATDPDGPHRLLIPTENREKFELALAKLPDSERITWTRHKIKPGDTLSTIARRYKTTVSHLKKVNRLKKNTIRAGRNLMIPGPGAADSSYTYSASQRLQNAQSRGSGHKHIHTVRKGDTLWALANRYNSSVRKIAKWNNFASREPLKLGQKLVIWQKSPSDTHTVANASTMDVSFSPALQTIRYTVKRGDSLDRIARRFNIRVADLFRWNSGLKKSKYIQPGQKIRVKLDVRQQSG